MNQLLRLVCFSVSYSGESSPNLPFIANKQYSLRYNVGVFDNEVFLSTTQFCLRQPTARLLNFMANVLKSNFQLVIPQEQISGELNDKMVWTGMMKLFDDKKIDFSFYDFSYSKDRQSVVKYSMAFEIHYRFVILSRKSFKQPNFNILSVFDIEVWLLMFAFFLLCLLVIFFVYQVKDITKVVLDFVGIFLGLGTVIDAVHTYIPRAILSLWMMGTLIFTFILRNEILALFSARIMDKIDSVEDIKARNMKVLVQNDAHSRWLLRGLHSHNIVPIVWADFWTLETKQKILSGSYVLISNEDKLDVMARNHEYPFRLSTEKRGMRFGFYLFRADVNRTLERKVNRCIEIMQQSGVYSLLRVQSFRQYETTERMKKIDKLKELPLPGKTHNEEEDLQKVRNLSMLDIDESFYSLFYGWVACYLLLMCELLLHQVRANVHPRPYSFTER